MHELGIVFHTIRTIEEVAAEQGLTRVGSVTLELGEVSGAIPLELVSCWDWAVNRTELLRGAPLKIETLPAVTHCEGCGENYAVLQGYTQQSAQAELGGTDAPAHTAAAKRPGCCGGMRSA